MKDAIAAVAAGQSRDPFAVLGPHRQAHDRLVVRTLQPHAASVILQTVPGPQHPMRRRDDAGLYEAVLPLARGEPVPDYRLRVTYADDHVVEIDDPYRYGRVLSDFDLHLFNEGTHHRLFEKLGAHRITVGDAAGVHFAVWAPNADRVSVIGGFNGWDGRVHQMRLLVPSGVWELFVPNLADGEIYKFEVRTK